MAQYTKKAIISTFFDLISKRSLDKITVKDIVDQCEINRNTFYYYYKDIYDLIEDIFQTEIQKVIQNKDTEDSFLAALKQGLQLIIEYKDVITNMYFSKSREIIIKYLIASADTFVSKFTREYAKDMQIEERDILLVIEWYKAALSEVMLRWIQDETGKEPDEFVQKLSAIYENTICAALAAVQKHP